MVICLKEKFDALISENFANAILCASTAADEICVDIFLIGGIVRDLIMNNSIKDIDIAVEGDALQLGNFLEEKFGCEVVSVQEKLRTSKVKFPNGVVIDFASTREERYTESGVLPVAFNFGCELEKDVKRRDFTINTLALKLSGENKFSLVDYFNGYDDIQNGQIKILHEKSFVDDPSRIIRALKFKERFDFKLEEITSSLMQEYLNNINDNMPLERVKGELRQYFEIKKDGLYSRFIESGAYKLISNNPIMEIDEDRFKSLYEYNLFDEKEKWFIYVMLLVLNSDYAVERLNMTSFEKKVLKEVRELMKKNPVKDKVSVYNLFKNLTDISICVYYVVTGSSLVELFLGALRDIKVLITGNDLINLGFLPSPYFNKLFDAVLKEKLDGKLKTKEEEIGFLKKYIKEEE